MIKWSCVLHVFKPTFSWFLAVQSPYGEPVDAEKAPEAISKAVASLPPEQMFELMKQMKVRPHCT